jgi:hypothetical protein
MHFETYVPIFGKGKPMGYAPVGVFDSFGMADLYGKYVGDESFVVTKVYVGLKDICPFERNMRETELNSWSKFLGCFTTNP